MPTTIRLLTRLAILAALIGGIIYALATYVEPTPEPVSIRIPTERFE
ncbi:MAG: histidine kinase [Cohaesibacteraceae bacterium]